MIPFVDFKPMEQEINTQIQLAFQRVFKSSTYISGREDNSFEIEFAKYLNVNYCTGCGNGLDALIIALKSLGISEGDEVIIPSNTFIATALAVSYVGAKPVFVEPDLLTYNIDVNMIENAISDRTKCIIPVHLYGKPCEMNNILRLSQKYHLYVLEDCAQAHGATYNNKLVGSFGNISAFSFYPGKNLGALGDAGAIVSNDKMLIDKCKAICNYGSDYKYHHIFKGHNSRLDELQAAFLRVKLDFLPKMINYRRKIARIYLENINNSCLILPYNNCLKEKFNESIDSFINDHVFHIFAIRCQKREKLEQYLMNNGVMTNKHYPIPIHLQECYKDLGYKDGDFPISETISKTELSIPMYYGMSEEQIDIIVKLLNNFE